MLLGLKLNKVQLALLSIYMIVAIDMLGTTLTIPVTSLYAQYLGATQGQVGLLYACFSGGAFISSLFVGRLSDKFGRRNVFLYCGFGAFIGFLGSGYAQDFTQFMAWRALAGLFTGTMGNAFAYVSDVVPEQSRPAYMSYVTAVMSTCLVIGPLIGGGLAIFGIRVPYHAATGTALVGLLMTYFFVHEPDDLFEKDDNGKPIRPSLSRQASAQVGAQRHRQSYTSGNGTEGTTRRDIEMAAQKLQAAASSETTPLKSGPMNSSTSTSSAAVPSASTDPKPNNTSPWLNPAAMAVGGLCTFLNTLTFTGTAVLMPLILMQPAFGFVHDLAHVHTEESQRISLFIGYILGMYGLVQAVGMIYLFPIAHRRMGLLSSGALGSFINGIAFTSVLLADKQEQLVPIYLGLAVGNCLLRPVIPAYLGSIAPKGRNAEYIALNATFSNLGMISSASLTALYAVSPVQAIVLTGGAGVLTAAIMFSMELYIQARHAASGGASSGISGKQQQRLQGRTPLMEFFGFGEEMEEELFWADVLGALRSAVAERRYDRAVRCVKGQVLIKELLLGALPELPEQFDAKMEALYQIYMELGHEDWAEGMTGHIESLQHHRGLSVPGIS